MLDGFSRYVRAWELSPSLEPLPCVRVLAGARETAGVAGEISNSDPGAQFTSGEGVAAVLAGDSQVRHDGRGRAWDHVMVERLWRSVKYEDIYLRDDGDPSEARPGLERYFSFYNTERPPQGLADRTPLEVMNGTP